MKDHYDLVADAQNHGSSMMAFLDRVQANYIRLDHDYGMGHEISESRLSFDLEDLRKLQHWAKQYEKALESARLRMVKHG